MNIPSNLKMPSAAYRLFNSSKASYRLDETNLLVLLISLALRTSYVFLFIIHPCKPGFCKHLSRALYYKTIFSVAYREIATDKFRA